MKENVTHEGIHFISASGGQDRKGLTITDLKCSSGHAPRNIKPVSREYKEDKIRRFMLHLYTSFYQSPLISK